MHAHTHLSRERLFAEHTCAAANQSSSPNTLQEQVQGMHFFFAKSVGPCTHPALGSLCPPHPPMASVLGASRSPNRSEGCRPSLRMCFCGWSPPFTPPPYVVSLVMHAVFVTVFSVYTMGSLLKYVINSPSFSLFVVGLPPSRPHGPYVVSLVMHAVFSVYTIAWGAC
jgi:hypothetical protein